MPAFFSELLVVRVHEQLAVSATRDGHHRRLHRQELPQVEKNAIPAPVASAIRSSASER